MANWSKANKLWPLDALGPSVQAASTFCSHVYKPEKCHLGIYRRHHRPTLQYQTSVKYIPSLALGSDHSDDADGVLWWCKHSWVGSRPLSAWSLRAHWIGLAGHQSLQSLFVSRLLFHAYCTAGLSIPVGTCVRVSINLFIKGYDRFSLSLCDENWVFAEIVCLEVVETAGVCEHHHGGMSVVFVSGDLLGIGDWVSRDAVATATTAAKYSCNRSGYDSVEATARTFAYETVESGVGHAVQGGQQQRHVVVVKYSCNTTRSHGKDKKFSSTDE